MNPFEKESFLSWLIGIPHRDSKKWERWNSRSPENKQFASQARLYLASMQNNKKLLDTVQVDALWLRIENSIGKLPQKNQQLKVIATRTIQLKPWFKIAIAASIILFISIASIYYLNQVTITAPAGSKTSYMLPDGSKVEINAAGKISFNKMSWKIRRGLSLQGEAFFNVTKGDRFTVFCPTASVSVLGTSFNIQAHKEYFKTECYTGRVRVKIPVEHFEKIITKNEAVIDSKSQKAVYTAFENKQSTPSWLNGEFYFDKVPFKLVLEEIENQYKVKFENIPGNDNLLFTGYFNNKDLNKALEFVLVPMGFSFESNQNQIKLINNKTVKR